ncbi:hypothetical protein [Flammeovirga sp. OC4]|uniref:hypothetical protein n=1 Tax=Flammeovirga sp. OC4 TaxID=1382345 RepID=UPI0012E099FD|nr:hypothetical protein [Flammeovirga sp. OC4]
MKNIDYSDISKFLVSLGIVLISISVYIPFLYLTNSFGLIISSNDYNLLADFSKDLIDIKYDIVISLRYIVPLISLLILLLGIFLFYKGFMKWNIKQVKLDLMDDYALEEKRRKIEQDYSFNKIIETGEESIKNNTKNNVQEIENHEKQKQSYVSQMLEVERKFNELLQKFFFEEYRVKNNQRLDSFEYDFILNSPMNSINDKILEIKYFKSKVSYHYSTELLNQLSIKLELYKSNIKENANGYLIIFIHNDIYESNSLNYFASNIKDFEKLLNGNFDAKGVKIKFLNLDSFENLSKESIRNVLEI